MAAPVIDADGHVQEPGDLWERYLDPEYQEYGPKVAASTDNLFSIEGRTMPRMFVPAPGRSDYRKALVGRWNATFAGEFARGNAGFSASSYLEVLDREGIDRMVLYPSRGLYICAVEHMDGGLSAALCRAYNRWLAEFCAADPDRLVPVALVALHDPELAAAEVRYAVGTLGMRGVMVRPNPVAGRNLCDRAHDVVFAEVAAAGVPLGIHEGSGTWLPEYGQDRYDSYLAHHAMSHPMEQMGAVYGLTVGGIFERHPDLRAAILEAGGTWLPYWLWRLDDQVEFLADVPSETGHLSRLPSEYFRRQGWISAEPSEPHLDALVAAVGADRILWASDYPHPDCSYPDMAVRARAAAADHGLDDAELDAYLGANAAHLYRLDPPR